MAHLEESLEEIVKFRDYAAVTAELYDMMGENIKLQAQADALADRNAHMAKIKAALEQGAREMAEERRLEKAAKNAAIMDALMAALGDAALQDRILASCLQDLQRIPPQ